MQLLESGFCATTSAENIKEDARCTRFVAVHHIVYTFSV